MQFHLLRALELRLGPTTRVAPVEVAEEFAGKWISRIQKPLGIPRRYSFYSESRLASFARAVEARLTTPACGLVVFFGALPFVKCQPARPYFIYTDGAFFIHYWEYNLDHSHARSEIERICQAEADFMRRADGVWCSSQWAASRIAREYNIPSERVHFVGTGPGEVPPPIEPIRYDKFLAMIAADFERKQGRSAVAAVAAARKLGVDVGIKFIGAKPPPDILEMPFVEWCGWLNLRQDTDRLRFAEVMSQAGANILLSRADLTPLAVSEAARYGKATFGAAVGGVPEMIRDGETGWLIRPEATATEIGEKIAQAFQEPNRLALAGAAARSYCAENWSWEAVANRALKPITI